MQIDRDVKLLKRYIEREDPKQPAIQLPTGTNGSNAFS
jgi:hypothetical protein